VEVELKREGESEENEEMLLKGMKMKRMDEN
jgi:hypothetical protein